MFSLLAIVGGLRKVPSTNDTYLIGATIPCAILTLQCPVMFPHAIVFLVFESLLDRRYLVSPLYYGTHIMYFKIPICSIHLLSCAYFKVLFSPPPQ